MTTEERFTRIETSLAAAASLQEQLQWTMSSLVETVTRYVESADARARRLEESLDGLIRAITAEHSNGKSEQ